LFGYTAIGKFENRTLNNKNMTVQINTDNNVEGHARLKAYIQDEVGTLCAF
jgi:hypothetical protein